MKTYKHGLQKLLNDETFWRTLIGYSLNQSRIKTLREYRTKGHLPGKTLLQNFIKEDYIPITKDQRPENEIYLELISKPE